MVSFSIFIKKKEKSGIISEEERTKQTFQIFPMIIAVLMGCIILSGKMVLFFFMRNKGKVIRFSRLLL